MSLASFTTDLSPVHYVILNIDMHARGAMWKLHVHYVKSCVIDYIYMSSLIRFDNICNYMHKEVDWPSYTHSYGPINFLITMDFIKPN